MTFEARLQTGENGIVNGDNQLAIFGPTNGAESELGVLARESQPAPGVSDGAVFDDFNAPIINDLGHVMFEGFLRNADGETSVTEDNDFALFAYADGELQLLVREGDLFTVELNDGTFDERMIASIGFDNFDYFGLTGLNNNGLVAFELSFEGGTDGVFTTQLGVVPEPTGASLLLVGLPLVMRLRKSRRGD